jgi:hypothetical protein
LKEKIKKTACPAGSLAQKKKGAVFSMKQGKIHAKRPHYFSSELKLT